jgi:hypothetical protein
MHYPRFAQRMGTVPETMMFRRFEILDARNWLYLQDDLIYLQGQLRYAEKRDKQRDLVLKIRQTLREYSMQLQTHSPLFITDAQQSTRSSNKPRCWASRSRIHMTFTTSNASSPIGSWAPTACSASIAWHVAKHTSERVTTRN